MTDKEILGELKGSYEYLEDILGNADTEQVSKKDKEEIQKAQMVLGKIYFNLRKNTKENTEYKENLIIAKYIHYDYEDISEKDYTEFVSHIDMDNEEKWWQDYKFLTE